MTTAYQQLLSSLQNEPKTWLVTGAAGFIGSHLTEHLLINGQKVVGLDNFATGFRRNLDFVKSVVGEGAWANFSFIEGDIRDLDCCKGAMSGVDYVLHQAALGSVPRSLKDPITSNAVNIDGFLNMLVAATESDVKRFVYASSSSVYGDDPRLPKIEENIGNTMSPYAITKRVNEHYARVLGAHRDLETVGLRYFNVFGPRQDPHGAYAAVIPKWVAQVAVKDTCEIYGDGETSRDFCYVENVVQANLLSACDSKNTPAGQALNVAVGDRTSLKELHVAIAERVEKHLQSKGDSFESMPPEFKEFRAGDVRHSQADTAKIVNAVGYSPTHGIEEGLDITVKWFLENPEVLSA